MNEQQHMYLGFFGWKSYTLANGQTDFCLSCTECMVFIWPNLKQQTVFAVYALQCLGCYWMEWNDVPKHTFVKPQTFWRDAFTPNFVDAELVKYIRMKFYCITRTHTHRARERERGWEIAQGGRMKNIDTYQRKL